jgi:hypothetical protein
VQFRGGGVDSNHRQLILYENEGPEVYF